MGLSASQARLLSITQRVNNNELKSEILANNKIRLADDGIKASRKYIDALSSKKLKFNIYDKGGFKEKVALTFNTLNNYNVLQSQYGVVSATGQLYVNDTDAKNFENSKNLYEFLNKYGLVDINDDDVYVISDTDKAQWYTNLWYRMDDRELVNLRYTNFGDDNVREMPDLAKVEKINGAGNYLVLDDVLATSSTWLQFALENGLATLTKIRVEEDYEGRNFWQGIEYTSVTDISQEDDTTAVERAEVEYEQSMKRIQASDKKLDLDIKKLDTEHSTLLKEYESVKKVMQKNVEKSFSAFS